MPEKKTALVNGRVFKDGNFFPLNVYIADGKIEGFSSWKAKGNAYHAVVDCTDKLIVPGYIDIHIHGRKNNDVMNIGRDPDVLDRLADSLLETGVTSFLPTLLTCEFDEYLRVLGGIAEYIDRQRENTAHALGIYSEGIFFNQERAGAHNYALLKIPCVDHIQKIWEASKGKLKILSLAPELEGAEESTEFLCRKGVVVSMGHSNASYEESYDAYIAGARGATHVMNAMKPIHHMEPSIIGASLYLDDITVEMIADGVHLKPEIFNILFRVKPPDKIVLITDSVWIAGMSEGEYFLGAVPVINQGDRLVLKDSKTYLLAGSCLTMDAAVRNAFKWSGKALEEVLRCATLNPASYLGVDHFTGQIKEGYNADVNILNRDLFVEKTFVSGHIFEHAIFSDDKEAVAEQ
jgi:N-acetylglucosamine-6-phosphate deacetylase